MDRKNADLDQGLGMMEPVDAKVVERILKSWKPALTLGLLIGVTSSLVGEYVFGIKETSPYGVLIGILGLLVGYVAGALIRRRVSLGPFLAIGKTMDRLLAILAVLMGLAGIIVSVVGREWFTLAFSILMTGGGYGMVRKAAKKWKEAYTDRATGPTGGKLYFLRGVAQQQDAGAIEL